MAAEPPVEIRPKPGFLQGSLGPLFILYYPPSPAVPSGGILYSHPFAEEMDKSRRMAALQACRFTATGFGVLQPGMVWLRRQWWRFCRCPLDDLAGQSAALSALVVARFWPFFR